MPLTSQVQLLRNTAKLVVLDCKFYPTSSSPLMLKLRQIG